MREELLSVGIDIGTSTTQLVISRLTLENRANPFSVPKVAIAGREVCYRSGIHFTPLLSDTVIDAEGVRSIVESEYQTSGVKRDEIRTGAVIITGETARKENAREVLSALSSYAGDFVVATAGPDLESILAARGAGADLYSREHQTEVLHVDIGGGTSNLALCSCGDLAATGCLDVGGRLMKLDPAGRVSYLSPRLIQWAAGPGGGRLPAVGQAVSPGDLAPVVQAMTAALEQAAGVRPGRDLLDFFCTEGASWNPVRVPCVSFSGGVADCIYETVRDPFSYGDIGVLLGRSIQTSSAFQSLQVLRGHETIRATVVGAGSYSTSLSGSTIFYRSVPFPMKNLPILKLTEAEERGDASALAAAIGGKLRWFSDGEGMSQIALGLRGERSPQYRRVQEIAKGIWAALEPLCGQGRFFPVVVVESDLAKALGQALAPLVKGPLLCLDSVDVDNGDYIDIGAPVAHGAVLPVVIKTLAFQGRP